MPQGYQAFAPPSVGCWAPSFLTKWWDLLDLSKNKLASSKMRKLKS